MARRTWKGPDSGSPPQNLIRSATRHDFDVEYCIRSILVHLPGEKFSELPQRLPDVWKREGARKKPPSPPAGQGLRIQRAFPLH